jgi:hypothetical protein
MLAYHGTPIGGNGTEIVRFLKGRHALVSFANQQDIDVVAKVCASFVLDNGAFTFWKRGEQVPGGKSPDWDTYVEWVNTWVAHPGFDWWIIPDVIDGTEDDNLKLTFWYRTAAPNGVPVYHMHESLEHLERLIAAFPRIALGSSGQWPTPGTKSWWIRMAEIMSVACDSNGRPRVKLHGLRMLNPDVYSALPLSSADSCNAGRNNGNTDRWTGYAKRLSASQKAEVLAWHIEHRNSAEVWQTPVRTLTALAGGVTYEQMIAVGWTDTTLIQHGYMTPGVTCTPNTTT